MKSISFLLVSITLGISTKTVAQTGPGGVGNISSNILWLEADNIIGLLEGDDITTWLDASGNNNDFSQPNIAFKPIYKAGLVNGLPAIRFIKTNSRIRRTNFNDFPTTAITEFYVNSNNEANDGVLSYASTVNNNDFLLFSSNSLRVYRGGNLNSGVVLNDNNWHIVHASWRNSDGGVEVWKDGNQDYTNTGFQTGASITAGGCLAIGGEQDAVDGNYAANQAHSGDFTEVIVYNTYLNTAQHIIVSNYLAAKYNLAIANDYFAYESSHGNDLAGIGREDVANTHTAAMSANVLQIQNPSGLDIDKEYLLFGHDNADISTTWTTLEAPNAGNNIQRLAREWRVNETGEVGNTDFIVDVANMPTLPLGHSMYTLMVDSDGDFSSGASVYEMRFSAGTLYRVSGLNINDGDYLAIAAVRPTVEYTTTTSGGFETTNALVEVSLNFIPRTAKTVDFTTSDGTASAAQLDYTAVLGGTIIIPAGSSTANIPISINNDILVESSETFTITLSNPIVGINLGLNTIHTYAIDDEDNLRKVFFDLSSSSGSEGISLVTLNLSINNVDLVNPTTVDFNMSGGTAIGGGTDYSLSPGSVTFAAGTTTASFSFVVNDDVLYENNETLIISLANPTNCNLDGIIPFGGTGFISHTYTINNNDALPIIQFNSTAFSGNESTSSVNFQVDLNLASGSDVLASYSVTGSATGGGIDYTLANGSLTINAGNTTSSITALITNDLIEELSETLILTISSPVNATIGSNVVSTYTIYDDDIFGYLGPGGVGNSNSNKLWVKSNDLATVADGTDITFWGDASGNNNDLSQGNTLFSPRYYSNSINGKPAVRFEQANGRIIHNGFTDFPSSEITTILVNSNNDAGDGVFSYATASNNNEYLWFSSNSLNIYRGPNINTGTAINGNTWRILGNTWRGTDGDTRFYRNGTQTFSGILAPGTSIVAGGCLAIAGEQDAVNGNYDANQAHFGNFSEILVYNSVLNSARRKIIDNYLSAKYNIAILNDLYAYDNPSSYENEVAGIGRDDNSNFHIDAQGTAEVRINTVSNLDNGEFLLWGHNNGTYPLWNTADVPPSVINRSDKVWRIDETGEVGTVSVAIDVTNFPFGNLNDLLLLIDTDDGSFVNATAIPISSFAANIATFNLVNFAAGNWFTIANLDPGSLPIDLISFRAMANGKQVDLEWITASETNNEYFTVERSIDGFSNWEEVIRLEGAGNSTIQKVYTTIDKNPTGGVSYYRLKQNDFDGQFSYSSIQAVFIERIGQKVTIYPNPTTNTIIISGSEEELSELQVFNLHGQEVNFEMKHKQKNKNKRIIDLTNLSSGIYIIRTKNTSSKVRKK